MAELCAEQGFAETTVAQVSSRAGVDAEVFEGLFADLEECLLAVVSALLGEVVSVIGATYSPDQAEWESGLRGMLAILELLAANPSFAHLTYIGARQMAPRVLKATEAGSGVVTAMLERLWEHSDAKAQPALTARAALGGAEAVARREVAAGRAEGLPRLLPDFVYGVAVPFLGQPRALGLAQRAREMLRGGAWE
jgi:AcrR family transcriptional regulator